MNRPSCSTPMCQCLPVKAHQPKNSEIPPAYERVVNSEQSRPNRRCRKNASTSATTTRSSSRTVQYRTPEGKHTTKGRTLVLPKPEDRRDLEATMYYVHHTPRDAMHQATPCRPMPRHTTPRGPPEKDVDYYRTSRCSAQCLRVLSFGSGRRFGR